MSRIPVKLVIIGTKRAPNELHVLQDGLHQEIVLVVLLVGEGGFDQMSTIVSATLVSRSTRSILEERDLQFMHVTKVGPSTLGINNSIVQIQIPIFLLSTSDRVDHVLDRRINLLVVAIVQEIAGALDPFC